MEVIILHSEAYQAILKELKLYVKAALVEVINEKKQAESSDWISIDEAKKLLPYKSKTSWQKFRDEGIIKFSQSGRTIVYSRKSILEFLNKNTVKF